MQPQQNLVNIYSKMSIIIGRDSSKTKVLYLHCRLCAFLKSSTGLVNLETNEKRRNTVLAQLSRLNISVTNLDSEHDILPKRICVVCISSLDKAYNFATKVQKAQEVLNIHILADKFKKENDHDQSLNESSDLPNIVENNGGVIVLSPASIQAIVESSKKSTGNNNTSTDSEIFHDKNVNDVVDRSKNNSSISQSFPTEGSRNEVRIDSKSSTDEIDMEINSEVEREYQSISNEPIDNNNCGEHTTGLSFPSTEGSNINELQIDTKLSTNTVDLIGSAVNEVKEEYKITVTDYQITSKPKSDKAIDSTYIGVRSDLFKEVKGEEISAIYFDFEEENIDENIEIYDNCSEKLKTTEVQNSGKQLMDFKEGNEVTGLINDSVQTKRIDCNLSGSYKENSVENAPKTDSEINIRISRCENHETQKMHVDEMVIKQETSSDYDLPNNEFEHLKNNLIRDCIRRTPVVVLYRISDADIVAQCSSSTALDNVKQEPGLTFNSNKSQEIHETSSNKNETEFIDDLLVISEISWEQYRWKCASCKETFSHIDKLITHSKGLHGYCNLYQCTECDSEALILDNFIQHLQGHREQLKYSCFKCFKTYPNSNSVKFHYKMMHAKFKLKCLGCHERFPNKEDLQKHCKKYKNKDVERNFNVKKYADGLTCKICQEVCTNLHTLLQHLEKSHSVQSKRYTCHECGKIYYKSRSLMCHVKFQRCVHYRSRKLCNESFKNAHDPHIHVYDLHGKNPFTCGDCGKKFKSKTTLQKHLLNHKGI